MTKLAELTTIGVGGEPARIVACRSRQELIDAAIDVWTHGDDWLVLGGGSNLVVADSVPELTVLQVLTSGIEVFAETADRVSLRVQAGENWDAFVQHCVTQGWAGVEALSGIPGTVGAAPMQNIGAYGQEVSSVITAVEFLDYETYELSTLVAAELGFGYRESVFKRGRLGVITQVEVELQKTGGVSAPVEFDQLASALGVALGERVALEQVRASVLKLRASKGMVLDSADPDTASCGSFFTNPYVSDRTARTLPEDCPRWDNPADDGATVKVSAAWLIERAGVKRGYALPGSKAAVSSKHTLAITNRGGATAREVAELAAFIQQRVANQFGINLLPEPNLVGF